MIVLATHDFSVAFELTDRIIVLKKTKISNRSPRDLVECSDILVEANLELPSLLRMMSLWRERAGKAFTLPLTVDEVLEIVSGERHCR
jgi:energy-coupling factor transporter ATP-binding protein EcfA2